MSRLFPMTRFVSRAGKDQRGQVLVLFALAAIPMAILIGIAVDLGRAHALRQKLVHAVDAAGLAAGVSGSDDEEELTGIADDFLKANLTAGEYAQVENLQLTLTDETIHVDLDAASIPMILDLINVYRIPLGVEADIVRETKRLEVALALDNTGSMSGGGKIGALRNASSDLVNILMGDEDEHPLVRISVVPYVTTVNVKSAGYSSGWIDWDARAEHHGENFDTWSAGPARVSFDGHTYNLSNGDRMPHGALFGALGQSWKGCVEARAAPFDVTDHSPNSANPDTLFVPYFWPDEPSSGGDYHNNYLGNDSDYGSTPAQQQRNLQKYVDAFYGSLDVPSFDEWPSNTNGPNMSCARPLLPLTNNKEAILGEISAMQPWNGSGTNGAIGLSWSWRALSPSAPFTQGGDYDDPDVKKALVLMTDGENQIHGGWNSHNKSNYSGYGYLSEMRLGTNNRNTAKGRINDRMSTLCENIKAEGITIYTITFRLSSGDLKDVFRACATYPEYYFDSTSNGELEEHFQTIAKQLTELRIAH